MVKGYICDRKPSKETRNVTDYEFDSSIQNAMYWSTKEDADLECNFINREGVSIPLSLGGTYLCRNFRFEERTPGEFVIYCEAPFVPQPEGRIKH